MSNGQDTTNWWNPILRFAAVSDIGMRRTNNQDSHREVPAASRRLWRTRGHLFVVADGMGAHAAGELASQIATETITQSYLKRTTESPYDAVRDAMLEAHQQIRRQGSEDDAFRDMGTTADALVLLPEGAVVGHVGDSRVYRLRGGIFEQLTFDHSLVWEIKRSGRIASDKMPAYIPKNVITRSLGPTNNPVVDLEGPFPIHAGDTFLLCSDGLSGQIEDDELAQVLSLFSPKEAAESLVNLANLRGGPDNITLIIVNVLGVPDPDEEPDKNERGYEKRPPLSPVGWLSFVCTFAAWLSLPAVFCTGAPLSALHWILLGAVTLALTGLTLFLGRKTIFHHQATRTVPKPLGRGPYVHLSAAPTRTFAQKLSDIGRQLREAVKTQNIFPDWERLTQLEQRTEKSLDDGDFTDAIFASMKSINLLMAFIKGTGGQASGKP